MKRRDPSGRWFRPKRLKLKGRVRLRPEQQALVEEHHDFAQRVARKIVTSTGIPLEVDEAIGCALVGLVDAANRFDPERREQGGFTAFAYPRIRGEIIDHLRRNSLVSRADVAEGTRVSLLSLDGLAEARQHESDVPSAPPLELVSPVGDPEAAIDVRDALNSLNERERYVVTAFAAGATYSEVAGGLGVSESRVWTIERFARAKLEREIAC